MNGSVDAKEDLVALPGTTFSWRFQIESFDFTDATAVMRVETLGDIDVPVYNMDVGVNEFGVFDLAVAPDVTITWPPGVYPYRVWATFADGEVISCVEGSIVVETP